jgi:hypothetical protein
MKFDSYTYLYPPRPEKAIPSSLLHFYETRQYLAQAKMNGTNNVLAISPERKIVAMSRHKEEHKLWTPTISNEYDFFKLPGAGWYVFGAELLHSKVAGLRNINYLHDIYVNNGDYLVGTTLADRQKLLQSLIMKGKRSKAREFLTHWEISPTLWLAKNHYGDFQMLYDKLDRPEHEGLVLKNPDSRLTHCQIKCRKAHKNYSF